MKVRRTYSNLRRVFAEGFAARDLAESLPAFDADLDAAFVRNKMDIQNYSVAGVRRNRYVEEYVLAAELGEGRCGDHSHSFEVADVLPDSASFNRLLKALGRREFTFLAVFGDVAGIVTRHDLQKAPMRMWLFGMITIVEMEFSRLIQGRHPAGEWREKLTAERLAKAERLMSERRRLNQRVNLVDCLQLSDKGRILAKDHESIEMLGFDTSRAAKETFKQLEHLRNNLAHAQDIVTYDWEMIMGLTNFLDAMFKKEREEELSRQ